MTNQKYFNKARIVFKIEFIISIILTIFMVIASYFILSKINFIIILGLILLVLGVLFFKHISWQIGIIVYPCMAICILFILATVINGIGYAKYDAGYQIALYLNKQQKLPIIAYQIDSMKLLSLDLYSQDEYQLEDNLAKIKCYKAPFYLVAKKVNKNIVVKQFSQARVIGYFYGSNIRDYLGIIIQPSLKKNLEKLDQYVVMEID